MSTDTKTGGWEPARSTIVTPTNSFDYMSHCFKSDASPEQQVQHQFTTSEQQRQFHSYIPVYHHGEVIEWKTSPWEHTDDRPFCAEPACMCHFHPQWVAFWEKVGVLV